MSARGERHSPFSTFRKFAFHILKVFKNNFLIFKEKKMSDLKKVDMIKKCYKSRSLESQLSLELF